MAVHAYAILPDDSTVIIKHLFSTFQFLRSLSAYEVDILTWNHTWTRDSLRCNFSASSSRANTSGYGARSNARSSSSNWNAVNVVLNDEE